MDRELILFSGRGHVTAVAWLLQLAANVEATDSALVTLLQSHGVRQWHLGAPRRLSEGQLEGGEAIGLDVEARAP